MSSLIACIKKAGKAMRPEDTDGVLAIYNDYLGAGMASDQAAEQALTDYIDVLETNDRKDLLDIIDEQGGDTRAARGEILRSLRSRAGRGGLRRIKGGARAKEYVGSPGGLSTPGQVQSLIRKLARLAVGGEVGRFWYERSGHAIMQAAGGDRVQAERFIGTLAIYSPKADVSSNTTVAMNAWNRWMAGEPIKSISSDWKDRAATKWLNEGVLPNGEKVSNFYNNLMRIVSKDPDFGNKQGVTVDLWMMRALGYETDAPTDAQYKFAQEIIHRVADKLGWEPQQVQAAMWVYQKAMTEKKPTETLKEALEKAKLDFKDQLSDRLAQLSWEAKPSRSVDVIPEIHTAPVHVQTEFQLRVSMALTDEHGTDLLAKELGLLQEGAIDGPAAWAEGLGHGAQVGVVGGRVKGGGNRVDGSTRRMLNAYADILGLVLKQDALSWHRPWLGASKKQSNGISIDLGRPVSHAEAGAIYQSTMTRAMAAGLTREQAQLLAPIATKTGFRVINNSAAQLKNPLFHGIVVQSTEEATAADTTIAPTVFQADTEIRGNNWSEFPDGQEYRDRISEEGFDTVLEWADRVLAGRLSTVYRDFADRYGWTYNETGQVDAKRAVAAPIPLDRLIGGGAPLVADVYGRAGTLNPGTDTTQASKIYNLDPLVQDPTLVERQLTDYGYQLDTFSFHEDKTAGVEIKLPRLGKRNYETGWVLIYDPRVAHGSFKDEQYTRAWRATHEMGHGISEAFMQERYGASRRYGRLGRPMSVTRGVGDKAVQVETRALTLMEAQRAVEWEDVAFRTQRMLLEEYGVVVTDSQFAQEFNINLTDATYRVLSGDFGNPGEFGFVPHVVPRDLRETLRLLENTEKVLAASQGRAPTPGIDLRTWKKVSDDALRDAVSARRAKQSSSGVRHSLRSKDVNVINANPSSPQAQYAKLNATVEQQMGEGRRIGRRGIVTSLKDAWNNNKGTALAAVPLRALQDFADPRMTAVTEYADIMNRMSGLENGIQGQIMNLVDPWKKLARADLNMAGKLAGVMHESTLAGVDPSKDFNARFTEKDEANYRRLQQEFASGEGNVKKRTRMRRLEEKKLLDRMRQAKYPGLRKAWDSLSDEAKAVYTGVRDFNALNYDRLQKSLEDRINQTAGVDGTTKSALIARLRREFESGAVSPYFPLSRFGKHWAAAKDTEGNVVSFSKFENPSDLKQWADEWSKQKDIVIEQGTDLGAGQGDFSRVDPAFAAKVEGFVKNITNKAEATRLADDIWQAYLKRLPEMSARKAFIHRKGVYGFTGDALRSFADSSFHMARQIAKAEYGYQLERTVEKAIEQARVPRNAGDLWATPVAEELARRHAWVMEPRVGKAAAALTSLGFHWFLGFNPSSAAVNLTQTWIVGLPVLAGFNGGNVAKVAVALGKASAQMVGTEKQRIARLTPDEAKAFNEFQRIGLYDKTRAAELIGAAEGSVDVTSNWHVFSMLSAKMFHVAEQFNREVTSIAAYRLARERGLDHTAAVKEAENATWDTHFDYSNKNRPRIMQNDIARVAFLFRNYGVNMSYRVLRDIRDSTKKDIPPAQRKAAISRAVGIWTMTMLNAGASGLPLVWAAVYAFNALFGDDDDPIDPKDAMRVYLGEQFGKDQANWIMDGVMDDLTGVAISSRVSLSNLWFMDAPYEAEFGSSEWISHYGAQLAGPLGSAVVDAAFGVQLIAEGQEYRGLEKVVPTEVRNNLRALRFVQEGVNTLNDETIVPKDEISAYESFAQAAGFTPQELDLQYKENRAKTGILTRLEARKDILRRRYQSAETPEEKAAAMAEIKQYDKKNPQDPIGRTLGQSMRSKATQSKNYQDGVRMPMRMMKRMDQIDFKEDE